MDFGKFTAKDQVCSRCSQTLGLRNHEPEDSWGFSQRLCHDCFETVKKGIKEYEVTYVGGHSDFPVRIDGWLYLYLFDLRNQVIFKPKTKDKFFIKIDAKDILNCKIVTKAEASIKKAILTAGFSRTKHNKYLQIEYKLEAAGESLIFDIGDEIEEARNTIVLMLPQSKANNPTNNDSPHLVHHSEDLELAPKLSSKPCSRCIKNPYSFFVKSENLCSDCFAEGFGGLLLKSSSASYYGGHKAYLAGGLIGRDEAGDIYLTTRHLIFTKRTEAKNRWSIIIPLSSVSIEGWEIEEQSRRKEISAMGLGGFSGIGFVRESGKSHNLVVAYTDENGIPQAPRFGVSSINGKAIRDWASTLYEQVANIKAKSRPNVPVARTDHTDLQNQNTKTLAVNENPLLILKKRLAMGEITKEQYEELRKLLES